MFSKRLSIFGESITINPLVLLVVLACVLRIPSLFEPYWYGDEGIYLTLGEGLRHGLVFYRDIYDHKPPAILLLAALANSVFWFRFILLVWHSVTIVFFWKLAQTLFPKNNRAVIIASTVFVVLTSIPLIEGTIANSEIFMIGPVITGLYLLISVENPTFKRTFLAGLLFSLAVLFKAPSFLDIAALFAFWGIASLWKIREIFEVFKRSAIIGITVLIPIIIAAIYYWQQNALSQFLSASFFQNISYLSRWSIPSLNTTANSGLQFGLLFRTEVLAIILLVILLSKKLFDKTTLFVSIWLLFTTFAMLLSGRPYPHYIIQAIPPLALALAVLCTKSEKYRFLPIPIIFVFLLSLVFYKFYYSPVFAYYQNFLGFSLGQKSQEEYFRYFDSRVPTIYKLAEAIVSRTTSLDRIFIWGTMPELYALTHRLPPGRYVTSFHIGDFQGEAETLKSLLDDPPRYIIRVQGEKRPFPGFDSFLHKNYLYLETIENVEVWKLASPKTIKALSS